MTNELTFITKSLFDKVTFDKESDSWLFSFADKIHASSSGFWRLLENNKIILVSLDHGHEFGLDKPLDLVERLNQMLTGKSLTKIQVKENTFDLTLNLTCNLDIEIFIASSGYETYYFSINDKRYIGLGSGDIAIMDNI